MRAGAVITLPNGNSVLLPKHWPEMSIEDLAAIGIVPGGQPDFFVPTGAAEAGQMITEHALLHIVAGPESDFELAFAKAKPLISSISGFGRCSLSRSLESPSTYLLLVEWSTVEAHVEGFRGSPQYQQWKTLLHHFYDPFPVVQHFAPIHSNRWAG